MTSKVQKSRELFEEAKTLMPGGVQAARRPKLFFEEYPIFMQRAKGSHIWDVDGNEYVDWMMSYGPVILGHSYPRVDQAVIEEMKNGFLFNLTPPMQLELAKKLIELIPCAEMVQFVATGSGATSAAVRIARAYTGREKIIRWGYHAWHDWAIGERPGILPKVMEDTLTFSYNDLDSLEAVLEKHKHNVACIIMMPLAVELPKPGFLEGVRDLADSYGAVLIFDEIRSWPRMSLGGAQEYYGVTPDMTTISKGIANGHSISAVSLKFRRWLNVERNLYDHAYVRVSNNGSSWTTVWENGVEVTDSSWGLYEYDISAVADGHSTVYLRWTMGETDGSWLYSGWNIDDVEIWAIDTFVATCADGYGNMDGTGGVDGDDIQNFVTCYLSDDPGTPGCACADMYPGTPNGTFEIEDVEAFVDCLLGITCP